MKKFKELRSELKELAVSMHAAATVRSDNIKNLKRTLKLLKEVTSKDVPKIKGALLYRGFDYKGQGHAENIILVSSFRKEHTWFGVGKEADIDKSVRKIVQQELKIKDPIFTSPWDSKATQFGGAIPYVVVPRGKYRLLASQDIDDIVIDIIVKESGWRDAAKNNGISFEKWVSKKYSEFPKVKLSPAEYILDAKKYWLLNIDWLNELSKQFTNTEIEAYDYNQLRMELKKLIYQLEATIDAWENEKV